jgi:hypothetical protein
MPVTTRAAMAPAGPGSSSSEALAAAATREAAAIRRLSRTTSGRLTRLAASAPITNPI